MVPDQPRQVSRALKPPRTVTFGNDRDALDFQTPENLTDSSRRSVGEGSNVGESCPTYLDTIGLELDGHRQLCLQCFDFIFSFLNRRQDSGRLPAHELLPDRHRTVYQKVVIHSRRGAG